MSKRQSIRKFKKQEVSKELIEKILQAGITAPSSMDTQPWGFVVVQGAERKKKIRELYEEIRKKNNWYEQDTEFIENVTPIIVTCEDASHGKVISCAMAIQNMLLAAESLGLGSLPVGCLITDGETTKKLKEIVGIPPEKKVVLVTLFGYKDEHPEYKEKKPLSEIIEWK